MEGAAGRNPSHPQVMATAAPRKQDRVGTAARKVQRTKSRAPRAGPAPPKNPATGSVFRPGARMSDVSDMLENAEHLLAVYGAEILPAGAVVELSHKVDGSPFDTARIGRLYALVVTDAEAIKALDEKSGVTESMVIALLNAYGRGDDRAVAEMSPGPLLKAVVRYIVYKHLISAGQDHFEELAEADETDDDDAATFEDVRGELERANDDALEPIEVAKMSCAEFGEYLDQLTEPDLGPPETPAAAAAVPGYIA